MSTTHVKSPTSVLQLGHSRCEITPPIGIYHRMWGAARHDAATGIHRPTQADFILLEPCDGSSKDRVARLQLDLVNLTNEQTNRLIANVAEASGTSSERVLVTHSHSHAAGFFAPDRVGLPGGNLIEPFLDELNAKVTVLARRSA